MNAMVPFVFEDTLFRVATVDGEPWFVARDVCKGLHLTGSTSQHTRRLPDDEKITVTVRGGVIQNYRGVIEDEGGEAAEGVPNTHTLFAEQTFVLISEPGLFRLIFRSDKPAAERLRRFVFHEVLPAIRRTGRYDPAAEREAVRAAGPALDEQTSRLDVYVQIVRLCERLHGKAAAIRLWVTLGLPDPGPDEAGVSAGGRVRSHGEERVDLVRRFLEACTVADARGFVRAEVLRRAYASWADETGAPELSAVELGIALARIGVRKRKASNPQSRTQVYTGLRLVDEGLVTRPLRKPEGAWQ